MSRAARLLLGLGLLCLAAQASAYQVMKTSTGVTLRWTALPMKFSIHSMAAPGLTAAATQQAVRAAYLSWTSVSCASFTSKDMGVVNLPTGNENDFINTHVWRSSWPVSYDGHALGITWTLHDVNSGKILDADTHYNPNYPWATSGAPQAIDAQSVATHEIGHQLGLDHSSIAQATMFYATGAGDTTQRSLHSDDIAGLCYLYPSGQTLPPECSLPEHCASGETCVNGSCVAVVAKGYGAPCSSPKDCLSAICIEYGSYTFCSQTCDSQPCPSGDQCLSVVGGGKACLPGSASMGTKLLGQPCQSGLDCKSGICVSVPGQGYLCSQTCSLTSPNCPTGFKCAPATSGGLCIPAEPQPPPPPVKKKLGEACTSSSECESNLCESDGTARVCLQPCPAGGAPTCPAGYRCAPLPGVEGGCVKEEPAGGGVLGDPCEENQHCQSRLCADDGDGLLYCTEVCDPEEGCPEDYECTEGEEQFTCVPLPPPPPPKSSGCALSASSSPDPAGPDAGLLLLALGLLTLICARRRR